MNHLMIFSIVLAFLSVHKGSLSCRFHEQNLSDVEQILVQTFKKKLLNELGFSSVPNVSNNKAPRIPSFYKHLIEAENRQPAQTTELDDDDFHAKTKRLFLFPDQVVSVTNGIETNLIFKSNPRNQALEIKSATLWIHITDAASKSVEQPDHGKRQLRLYKSYQTSRNIFGVKELFHSEDLNTAGWYKVEVTGIAKEWFSVQPKLDLSLDIAVKGTKFLEIGGVSGDGEPLQPFLVAETKEKQHTKRRKRQTDSVQKCPHVPQKVCCIHDLIVNLSWDFVIAPKSLNIGVCMGLCPLSKTSLYGNEQRTRALSKHNSAQHHGMSVLAQRPCCAPNKMDYVKLLAFDQNRTVREYKLNNMKVTSCHCVV